MHHTIATIRLRRQRRRIQLSEYFASDPQPFRCVDCGAPVSHVNPELTPCKCAKEES